MSFPQGGGIGFQNRIIKVLEAGNVIINKNGMFMFSSLPPVKGNLVLAYAPVAGGTIAGNIYPQGFNQGVWSAATGALLNHFGTSVTGNLFLASSSGVTVVFGQSSDGSLLFYNAAGRGGAGDLNVAIAPAAGNDGAGGNYVEGVTVLNGGQVVVQGSNNAAIKGFISAGNPIWEWLSGYVNESQPAYIQTNLFNIGLGNELIAEFIRGPSVTGSVDAVFIEQQSAPQDASNDPFGTLGYQDTAAANHGRLVWDKNGCRVFNSIDGNTYLAERQSLGTTAQQLINAVAPAVITGLSSTLGIGRYHITGCITYECNVAGGTPTLLVAGQNFSGNINGNSEYTVLNAGATQPLPAFVRGGYPSQPGPVTVVNQFVKWTFDIWVTTITAGGLTVQASTSVAADTFTIQQGSWMEVFPVDV